MNDLKQTLRMTVEVLSPVHIGDGGTLHKNIDYVTQGNRTYVIDEAEFIDWAYDENDTRIPRPGEVLQDEKRRYSELDLWRYVMVGEPEKNDLRSHIKDVYGGVYLPGSSLKGMLRTSFVRGRYILKDKKPDLTRLKNSRSWAGQQVERDVMGRNPNYDLFRAVQIADTPALDTNRLKVFTTSVYPTGKRNREGVLIDVECIRQDTIFETKLVLDRYGFNAPEAAQQLAWNADDERDLFQYLLPAMRDSAEQRLRQERRYFKGRDDAKVVRSFYGYLLKDVFAQLQENQFIAQVGWGCSWQSKTLNDLVQQDDYEFMKLVHNYNLKGRRNLSRDFKPGDLFPASRTLIQQGGDPKRPLGWVKVTLE